MKRIELVIDVSAAVSLGEPANIVLTIDLPEIESLDARPIVCFATPGGGFSRGYFTERLPGLNIESQSQWHAARGWIFVSIDHLGVGSSSIPTDPRRLDYATVPAANHAAAQVVLRKLAEGELLAGLPAIRDPVVLGLGQSMGGSLTIVQQGRYHNFHGVGILGFSSVHTHPAVAGMDEVRVPWLVRDTLPDDVPTVLNQALVTNVARDRMAAINRLLFYYEDLGDELINLLMQHPAADQPAQPWVSRTFPVGVVTRCLTPGVVASEAAAIRSPVLVAMGERDVIADPKGEPRAYLSATSVDLYICPRMGHMHNFATSREHFWRRIETWGEWVKASLAAH